MFLLDHLQTLFGGRNMLLVKLLVVGLQPLSGQSLSVGRQFAFSRAHFLLHGANRINKALPRALSHVQPADLVGDFNPQPGYLTPQASQLFRLLAARFFRFRAQLGPLFQRVLEKLANIFDAFDGPLAILFGFVFFAGEFSLFGEGNHFANVEFAGGEFFAHPDQFAHGDRRSGDRFLGLDLAALDAFGDGDFALSRQQRHDTHLAQIQPYRIVGLFQRTGGKIQLQVFVGFFVVGGNRSGLFD